MRSTKKEALYMNCGEILTAFYARLEENAA